MHEHCSKHKNQKNNVVGSDAFICMCIFFQKNYLEKYYRYKNKVYSN